MSLSGEGLSLVCGDMEQNGPIGAERGDLRACSPVPCIGPDYCRSAQQSPALHALPCTVEEKKKLNDDMDQLCTISTQKIKLLQKKDKSEDKSFFIGQ